MCHPLSTAPLQATALLRVAWAFRPTTNWPAPRTAILIHVAVGSPPPTPAPRTALHERRLSAQLTPHAPFALRWASVSCVECTTFSINLQYQPSVSTFSILDHVSLVGALPLHGVTARAAQRQSACTARGTRLRQGPRADRTATPSYESCRLTARAAPPADLDMPQQSTSQSQPQPQPVARSP